MLAERMRGIEMWQRTLTAGMIVGSSVITLTSHNNPHIFISSRYSSHSPLVHPIDAAIPATDREPR